MKVLHYTNNKRYKNSKIVECLKKRNNTKGYSTCEEIKEIDSSYESKEFSVFVGGIEVNDHYLTKSDAERIAQSYIDDDYDDVKVVSIKEKQ